MRQFLPNRCDGRILQVAAALPDLTIRSLIRCGSSRIVRAAGPSRGLVLQAARESACAWQLIDRSRLDSFVQRSAEGRSDTRGRLKTRPEATTLPATCRRILTATTQFRCEIQRPSGFGQNYFDASGSSPVCTTIVRPCTSSGEHCDQILSSAGGCHLQPRPHPR